MEIWKKSPLAPDFIEVSNMGRVKTIERVTVGIRLGKTNTQRKRGRVLSPWVANNGYVHISVQLGPSRKKFLLHRLIAAAFCSGFDAKLTVNHIDGVKIHNYPENLEWVTLEENTALEWKTGLINLRGEQHPLHKLKDSSVIEIVRCLELGQSAASLARRFGVSGSLVYKIKKGTRHPHVE